MLALRIACLALALSAGAAFAQGSPAVPAPSPILTLDQERLFAETLWGKRAAARIEEASAALTAENRRIEAELTAEERALTDRRATMDPAEFRAEADAFDAKVTEIRQQQDAKVRAIGRMQDSERQRFFAAAFPVIEEAIRSRGAVAVLDSRAIFLAADTIDVTDELIESIDAALGPGTPAPIPGEDQQAPQPGGDGTGAN